MRVELELEVSTIFLRAKLGPWITRGEQQNQCTRAAGTGDFSSAFLKETETSLFLKHKLSYSLDFKSAFF